VRYHGVSLVSSRKSKPSPWRATVCGRFLGYHRTAEAAAAAADAFVVLAKLPHAKLNFPHPPEVDRRCRRCGTDLPVPMFCGSRSARVSHATTRVCDGCRRASRRGRNRRHEASRRHR
jgi:hypothetical protein